MRGYHDLAGTGCIHLCGGTASMVGALCLGPRLLNNPKKLKNLDREKLLQEQDYQNVLKGIESPEDKAIFQRWFLA